MFVTQSITQLPTDASHIYAFDVHGHVSDDDAEALARFMNAAFDMHDSVCMLMRLTDYKGSDVDTLFDWDVLKSRVRALSKVDRYAVVGAPGGAAAMIKALDLVIPVDARAFDAEDEDAAWAFVGSPPAASV